MNLIQIFVLLRLLQGVSSLKHSLGQTQGNFAAVQYLLLFAVKRLVLRVITSEVSRLLEKKLEVV